MKRLHIVQIVLHLYMLINPDIGIPYLIFRRVYIVWSIMSMQSIFFGIINAVKSAVLMCVCF